MKWGIVVLLILGAVAAACAALLVGAMGAGSSASTAKSTPGFEVVVAAKSLPAMTVITLEDFTKQAVARNELPQGQQLVSSLGVVGRILAVPVVEGQVLTESCFVPEGTGAQLAAALPEGMRAFTVNVSGRGIPDEFLLYPGCVVDVLVSFKLSSSTRSQGQAISTTMLRGIQVLAVSGQSVVSNGDEEQNSQKTRNTSRGLQVTLLVDSKQAEALQLAADNGSSISLAIRNPLDKSRVHMEGTVLSQGRLANLGSLLTPAVLGPGEKQEALLRQQPVLSPSQQAQTDNTSRADLPAPAPQPLPIEDYQARQYPRWGITVIRGRETKTEELAISGSETAAVANQGK